MAKKPEKFGQSIGEELNYARDDIRQKVVEQGWSGKETTPSSSLDELYGGPQPEAPKLQDGELRQSRLDDLYGAPAPEAPDAEYGHEHGIDIEE